MKNVLKKVQDQFWKDPIHTTTTTNCECWDEFLVRGGKYIYFTDIDYNCQNVAIWDTLDHLRRIQHRLLTVGKEGIKNEATLADVLAALDYWLDNDFKNPNWWFNQIGMVSTLAAITLMILDKLSPAQHARAAELIKRGTVAGDPRMIRWTGANLIWGIRDTVYYALIVNDTEMMRLASDRIAEEIKIGYGLDEGIKPDMSFYQHGPMLYSCGYGRSFTYETAQLISILSGSEYAVASDKIALFEDFVLDGQRYMMRGAGVDYQSIGREIARPGTISSKIFATVAQLLLNTEECRRKDELAAYYKSLTTGEDTFTSTKYFHYCYFLSHRTPEFHISVKGHHTNYKGTEWGLSENRLGYNLNCGGVTTFMATGNEYNDINPLTDYSAIPGTTAPKWDETKLWDMSEGDWKSKTGTNDDCGGCTTGSRGAIYMRIEHDGIFGYKAYFPFEDGIVCLGCALDAPETLYTTVDQSFRVGDLFEARTLTKGESVINGGFRYVNLSDVPMTAEAKTVTGAWSHNSPAQSSDPVTGNIFIAQIDHSKHDTYAYAVLAKDASTDKIAAIVNTPEEQSVTFIDGKKIAVIRKDGETRIVIGIN
ncbi:MAG: hypothetical protein J6I45_02835 [Clostridia bacterium]|nr:hypothetical protein [Clostridia bacterium]